MNNIHDFLKMKQAKQKISMITCYDYNSACIIENTTIDCVLVGDSAAMVIHGEPTTTQATIELLAVHTRAVAKGVKTKFIIADLPFLSYRKSQLHTMQAIEALIQAGAQAVKLEGTEGNLDTIKYIISSGVPVMGHIGLTPQHIHQLGGFKVQGKNEASYQNILQQALQLEAAGCFSIVLECIPKLLAAEITQKLTIPTIGIGAGKNTDGQVLVWHDLLGLQNDLKPKFVKHFLDGKNLIEASLNQYSQEVRDLKFPGDYHAY